MSATEFTHRDGLHRTDMYCHECGKKFVARVDHSLNGDHVLICPHCGHEHYRKVLDGVVTESRWSSNNAGPLIQAETRCIWQHDSLPMQTNTVSAYLRDLWLNRVDAQ